MTKAYLAHAVRRKRSGSGSNPARGRAHRSSGETTTTPSAIGDSAGRTGRSDVRPVGDRRPSDHPRVHGALCTPVAGSDGPGTGTDDDHVFTPEDNISRARDRLAHRCDPRLDPDVMDRFDQRNRDLAARLGRHFATWTVREELRLRRLVCAGWSVNEVAEDLRRSPRAVMFRVGRMGGVIAVLREM